MISLKDLNLTEMETENTVEKTFSQGKGDDELKMKVHITSEEEKIMEQIKSHSPIDWEGKDLELLMEARKVIKESKQNEEFTEKGDATTKDVPYKESSNKSSIIWLSIGLAGIVFLIVIFASVKRKADEATKEILSSPYAQSLITKKMDYQGVSFNYPGNWNVSGQLVDGGIAFVAGTNEKDSEFSVIVIPNDDRNIETVIDAVASGYSFDGRFSDVSYSSIYKTTVNKKDAYCIDYSYIHEGESYFAKIYGFVVEEANVIVNPIAHGESDLEGDDFKMMVGSLEIKPYSK